MHRLVVLMLLAGGVAVAAPVPKQLKKRTADGTWEVTEWYSGGNKVNATSVVIRWTIDADQLTIDRVAKNGVARKPANPPAYTLVKADPSDPKAVDYTATYAGGNRVITYPGRMEVHGDILRFCMETGGGARPAECKASETTIYYEFKRVKADDK